MSESLISVAVLIIKLIAACGDMSRVILEESFGCWVFCCNS